jgi:hypothetical protein
MLSKITSRTLHLRTSLTSGLSPRSANPPKINETLKTRPIARRVALFTRTSSGTASTELPWCVPWLVEPHRPPSPAIPASRAPRTERGAAMPGLFSRRSPTAGIAGFFRTGRAPSRAPTCAGEDEARVIWRRRSPSSHGPRDPRVSHPARALAGGSRPSRRRRHRAPSAPWRRAAGPLPRRRAVNRRGRGVAAARFDDLIATRERPTCRSRADKRASRSNPRAPASPRAFPRALPETLEAHAALATFSSIPTDAFSPSPRPLHRCSPRMSTS